ncbi:MAG: archease [Aeropyrum sp.]|nr:archease [Aeropyrum sp.]MCE4615977.1 archease [Aeropyrum sp.]
MARDKCGGWEHDEHTADVLVRAWGRTLEEAIENSAIGVYEVITDTSRVKPKTRVDLNTEGIDMENLLYRFVEELLAYTDADGLVFSIVRVCKVECGEPDAGCKIAASAWGEKFDDSRHEHRTIVKAMTYADMEISRVGEDCWKIQFVVDI